MTTALDFKYTDRDVREGGVRLVDKVLDYLRTYQGEFEFLRDAKTRVEGGNSLNIATVRGVLNCMRHDARYLGDLPVPEFSYPERRRLRVVRDLPERARVFNVNAKFKYDYWYTTNERAKWYHVVNKASLQVRWYTSQNAPQYFLKAVCGKDLREHRQSGWAMNPTEVHSMAPHVNLCPVCKGV